MITGFIYCITNNINGKMYVGKTMLTIEQRFKEHLHDAASPSKEKRPLYDAINKYGAENFSVSLLEAVEYSQLNEREQYWIAEKNTYYNGYNATLGGDGTLLYDYTKMVQAYEEGKLIKDIAADFQCDIQTVRKALRAAGLDTSKNQAEKLSQRVQATFSDGTIKIFTSYSEAARWLVAENRTSARALNGIVSCISRAARGKRASYLGIIWTII